MFGSRYRPLALLLVATLLVDGALVVLPHQHGSGPSAVVPKAANSGQVHTHEHLAAHQRQATPACRGAGLQLATHATSHSGHRHSHGPTPSHDDDCPVCRYLAQQSLAQVDEPLQTRHEQVDILRDHVRSQCCQGYVAARRSRAPPRAPLS